MKLYKKLTLGLIFVFITACGNSTTDGNGNTALDAFARKLANNNTPTIYKSSSSYALISDDGKTITSGIKDAFGSTEAIKTTWTLTATNTTANTATYAKNGAANSSTDLVLTFADINATSLSMPLSDGVRYGDKTAVNATIQSYNNFISVLFSGLALKHEPNNGKSITLTGDFEEIETPLIERLKVINEGATDKYFGTGTAGDYTIETTLTLTEKGIKAVIVLTKAAGNNTATEDLIRNTITIPNLEDISAQDDIELSGRVDPALTELRLGEPPKF